MLPFPSPGDLPDPGVEPRSLALANGFSTTHQLGKPIKSTVFQLKKKRVPFIFGCCSRGGTTVWTGDPGPRQCLMETFCWTKFLKGQGFVPGLTAHEKESEWNPDFLAPSPELLNQTGVNFSLLSGSWRKQRPHVILCVPSLPRWPMPHQCIGYLLCAKSAPPNHTLPL